MALQTLIQPPPLDASKSPVENALQLTPLTEFGPVGTFRMSWLARFSERLVYYTHVGCSEMVSITQNIYTNTRPLWYLPGARGIYGGSVIAQCLSAAQETVPAEFAINSMHCYFVLAGNTGLPVIYNVEHVREGRSFATRTVQAKQNGRCIFITTLSFVRDDSGGQKTIRHTTPMTDVEAPKDDKTAAQLAEESEGTFQSYTLQTLNGEEG